MKKPLSFGPFAIIDRSHLIAGLIYWAICTYIWYAFLFVSREVFRFFTAIHNDPILPVYHGADLYLNNLFLASIACYLGYANGLWFFSALHKSNNKTRLRKRTALNHQAFAYWGFLFVFFKIMVVLGLTSIMGIQNNSADFLHKSTYFLFLLPLILLVNSAMGWRSFFAQDYFRFLGITLLISIALSTGLAFKNVVSIEGTDEEIKSRSIWHQYNLELPVSNNAHPTYWFSYDQDILLMENPNGEKPVLSFPKGLLNEREEITDWTRLADNLPDIPSWEPKRFRLLIDKDIPMSEVDALCNRLRKTEGFRNILFVTHPTHSIYPPGHPFLRTHSLIRPAMLPYSKEFEAFLDSAETLDPNRYRVRLSASDLHRVWEIRHENHLALHFTQEGIRVNRRLMEVEGVTQLLEKLITKHGAKFTVIISADKSLPFGQYIFFLDNIYGCWHRIQNRHALEHFGVLYNELTEEDQRMVRQLYPLNVIQWSPEEERLIKMLER